MAECDVDFGLFGFSPFQSFVTIIAHLADPDRHSVIVIDSDVPIGY